MNGVAELGVLWHSVLAYLFPGLEDELGVAGGFCKRLSYCHNHRSPARPRRRWGRLTPYIYCSI